MAWLLPRTTIALPGGTRAAAHTLARK